MEDSFAPHFDNIVHTIMAYQDKRVSPLHVLDLLQRELDSCYEISETTLPRIVECDACHGKGTLFLYRIGNRPFETICKFCNGDGHLEITA